MILNAPSYLADVDVSVTRHKHIFKPSGGLFAVLAGEYLLGVVDLCKIAVTFSHNKRRVAARQGQCHGGGIAYKVNIVLLKVRYGLFTADQLDKFTDIIYYYWTLVGEHL